MRKLFVITLGMLLAVPAIADTLPTIYGQLNREFQHRSLEAKTTGVKKVENMRSVDVGNSESRIGLKGDYQFNDHTAKYVIELGLNSSVNNDTTGRLRMRQSYADVGGFWGSVILGQTDPAGMLLGLTLDPLSTTSAGLLGADMNVPNNSITGDSFGGNLAIAGIGYFNRDRADLLGYRSPNFMGIQYFTTMDHGNDQIVAAGKTSAWSNQLTFEKKMGEMDFGAYAAYVKVSNTTTKETSVMGGGLKFGFMGFTLTGMYSKAELTLDQTGQKAYETTAMMIAGKYNFLETNTVAITYGKRANEDANVVGDLQKDNVNQLAFGYIKDLHKNVSVRATYAMAEKKFDNNAENTAAIAARAGGFDVNTIALGTRITF